MSRYGKFSNKQKSKGGAVLVDQEKDDHELQHEFELARRGYLITEGKDYSSQFIDGVSFCLRHSRFHRKQFDYCQLGIYMDRVGVRDLPTPFFRQRAREAKANNTTYESIGLQH